MNFQITVGELACGAFHSSSVAKRRARTKKLRPSGLESLNTSGRRDTEAGRELRLTRMVSELLGVNACSTWAHTLSKVFASTKGGRL